jgi:hypothetical protein
VAAFMAAQFGYGLLAAQLLAAAAILKEYADT